MGMIEQLVAQHAPQLVERLTQGAAGGLDATQAKALVPAAGQQLDAAVADGRVALGDLAGGGIGPLLAKLDVGAIASAAGIDRATAEQGLAALIPAVQSLLGDPASGAGKVLGGLGGDDASALLGAAGKLAGGLFGKR